jgi:phosphatidylserine/phosphatidylglycerophosphate/cardiolipin synthase-like enzyme
MKRILLPLLVAFAATSLAFDAPTGKFIAATGEIAVAFTPGDSADQLVVNAIRDAHKQILVQAFSFTHRDIASALIKAQRRGVQVIIIADPEQAEKIETSVIDHLAAAKVPILADHEHVSAHNKIMVIDAGYSSCAVVTGSYNFTHAAQFKNAENLLVLKGNPPVCEAYEKNWNRHRAHSKRYQKSATFGAERF